MAIALLALLLHTACSGSASRTGGGSSSASPTTRVDPAQSTQTPAALAETGASSAPAAETAIPSARELSAPAQTAGTEAAAPAPACGPPAALTPAMTEGPYFKAGSPERSSLVEPGVSGERLVITGYVLTVDCQPIANARIDFWQADAQGVYDNTGFKLRGHLFTDETGRYRLETIVPGEYPGRTEHIHVKVQPRGGNTLTTQLFFPGVQSNESDRIFSPQLLMEVQDTGNGLQAVYDFVVNTQ